MRAFKVGDKAYLVEPSVEGEIVARYRSYYLVRYPSCRRKEYTMDCINAQRMLPVDDPRTIQLKELQDLEWVLEEEIEEIYRQRDIIEKDVRKG